ncbi:quinone oxidoreductase family protein [Sphingomonas astaxanthinifaciens]|uniref:Quinone oxidoreductase n=1 Tax=Sphingomonas astaxanthinifaciens DSM 22298 TaxID=1123267 RepID=A0ABQ5Z4A1_9SPHN|nr:quinone oxidoreductase [Sphingomonas astaxanthinifaciens]GLR47623.1 quinone oxidoreductase [Sphingomonas astaxanthinifaciens DSM 22298]
MKALRAIIRRTGGPEVIEWEEVGLAAPGPGQVLMANEAIGINFIDTYHRSGVYPVELPSPLGMEAAGRVLAAGPGVALKEGDRVATFGPERGAYSTARLVEASNLLPVPEDVPSELAAAALLKGCTAEFLVERCAEVKPGMDVLVHAAAGGVGLILVQWLKAVGARVIGTVSTEAKARLASEAGADAIIRYDHEEVAPRVRELTGGKGCAVVFDGVGRDTWEASLDSAAKRGKIVSYGNASAPVTGINLGVLAQKGSLWSTRPTLFDYYAAPAEREAGVARLWEMIRAGKVKVTIGGRHPLTGAAEVHRLLEARQTTGSQLLVP